MDVGFIWLVVGELIVITIVIIARLIFKKMEEKKVNKVLNFIERKSKDKDINDKFKECLEIIRENNKCER